MRMIDRTGIGCAMCARIPVPNEEDMQWMRSGQPLISLLAEAYEEQKKRTAGEPEPEPEEEKIEDFQDAVEAMNSTMDDLEALFGFGDAPVSEEEAPPSEEEEFFPLTKDDTKLDPLMYHYKDADYLMTPSRDHEIRFCPFCGSRLAEINHA